DVEKIRLPSVSAEPDETARRMELLGGLVGDLLPVRRWGIASPPRSTWDVLIEFYGIQELYEDMFDRPQLVHKAIDRMTQAVLHRHEQYEALGLLELNNVNCRVGTGGLGYTGELPAADFDGTHVRMKDCWGGQMAQIFSEVSPAMHDEFALQYELRLMERFGLNYYGCCEPLHKKVHLLHRIPRLRKVSMSPFVNWREGAEAIGRRYVYSAKPNPAVLASDRWDGERARRDLREILQATKGCHVEIILKDIHTVRNQPQRLWEWARIAMEEVRSFAG
ncbi:MAG TPA: hypothetical protein DCX07_07010, partial [Phycisphaerales bacterium]|nr:hypothetical protein [Phycisphaerales bacterium]